MLRILHDSGCLEQSHRWRVVVRTRLVAVACFAGAVVARRARQDQASFQGALAQDPRTLHEYLGQALVPPPCPPGGGFVDYPRFAKLGIVDQVYGQ